jgi:formyltetrahydrofolate deformylase
MQAAGIAACSCVADYVLTFSCPDRPGLVHAVSSWLVGLNGNILDSDQFRDDTTERFFMRVHFEAPDDLPALNQTFIPTADAMSMDWQIWPTARRPRVLMLVSKIDHCLADLLYRRRIGELKIDVPLIASNHRDAYPLAAAHDVDFLHLPVSPETKSQQEARLLEEVRARDIDFIVLARYMQILSAELCAALTGRIINIHHSFLPGFKGARPYHQAHERGVKLIGATAHYVTADLDDGPIIEQDVERVDHRMSADQLAAVGRDIERVVLAKAVRYQSEHRILLNGNRTVVFT